MPGARLILCLLPVAAEGGVWLLPSQQRSQQENAPRPLPLLPAKEGLGGDAAPVTSQDRESEPSLPGRSTAEEKKCTWLKGHCPGSSNKAANPFCTDPTTWRRCSQRNRQQARGLKKGLWCLMPTLLPALKGNCALFSSLPVRYHSQHSHTCSA